LIEIDQMKMWNTVQQIVINLLNLQDSLKVYPHCPLLLL